MPTEMRLPELGENIESGDVLQVLVVAGDRVRKDQPVIELETDKATIEVPSSVQGVVREVKVKAGDKVKVGQPILLVDEAASADTAAAAPAAGSRVQAGVPGGGGPPRTEVVASLPGGEVVSEPETTADARALPAPAAPSARRLARELGVNISEVRGSGPGRRISTDDVAAHARRLLVAPADRTTAQPLPDFTPWGAVERKPMTAVRRATAHHLSQAWGIPHVTQHDRADITDVQALRKRLANKAEEGAGSLTVTAFALKAVASALTAFPHFNASIDMAAGEIIYKKYMNVGVAVDTDRGLLVPVIRGVDAKSIRQLAQELTQVAERARARKLTLDEMQGGTFTVTNLGGIGGTHFSPIINWPEVAILGLSRAAMQPVYVDGRFEPRLMLPLSLSYDHRAVDGADAARFLRRVVEDLESPALLELLD